VGFPATVVGDGRLTSVGREEEEHDAMNSEHLN